MADTFYGEIRMFPYMFAPLNWATCDGSLLSVQQNNVLFAIIGASYGGNAQTTFAVPNLTARVAVGVGDDPTDTFDPAFASSGGVEVVTITPSTIPPHTHTLQGAELGPKLRVDKPAGNLIGNVAYFPATGAAAQALSFFNPTSGGGPGTEVGLNSGTLTPFLGGGQPHENRQPYLTMRYCICVIGEYFPLRD